jgi:hypothetical protein
LLKKIKSKNIVLEAALVPGNLLKAVATADGLVEDTATSGGSAENSWVALEVMAFPGNEFGGRSMLEDGFFVAVTAPGHLLETKTKSVPVAT